MHWTLKIKSGKVIYTQRCLDVRDCEIPLRIGRGGAVISLQTLCGFLMNVQCSQLSSSTESGWEQGCFWGALQRCIRSNGRTVQSEIQTSHKIYALSCREMWNAESFDDASSASEASTHTVWGASVCLFSLLFFDSTIATTSDRICTSVAVTLQQTLLIYKPLG